MAKWSGIWSDPMYRTKAERIRSVQASRVQSPTAAKKKRVLAPHIGGKHRIAAMPRKQAK